LSRVLDRIPSDAPAASYAVAIVEENLLGKPTRSTRKRTAKRLAELYALDPGIPLFRLLRYYSSGRVEGDRFWRCCSRRLAIRCSAIARRTSRRWAGISSSPRRRSPAGLEGGDGPGRDGEPVRREVAGRGERGQMSQRVFVVREAPADESR